jgi:hypothetical protein
MSVIIEAAPDRGEEFGDSPKAVSTPETVLAGILESAYRQRFALYARELAQARNLRDALVPNLAPSDFPRVFVVFDGEEEEVVFDFSLYERLLEIYIFEGWFGIVRIEEALDKRLSQTDEDRPSAGTPVNARTLWLPVKTFFRCTRNLLALLIRETLVQIERKAARAIAATLSVSAKQVAKAWETDFQIEVSYKDEYVPFSEGRFHKRKVYRLKDRTPSNTLFAALSEAVRQKVACEQMLQRTARFRQDINTIRGYLQRTKKRAQPREKPRLEEGLAQLSRREEEAQRLTEQSIERLKSILAVIHLNCPLGLIVLDGLRVGFLREEMEQKLGEALWELYQKIDEIAQSVDPGVSRIAAAIPPVDAGEPVAAVQRWKPPPRCLARGIEAYLVDAAVGRLAGDPGWFPLAHEATWHRLVESGTVAKDSFEYVVYFHYVSALIERNEAIREAELTFGNFWKAFGRIAAALSLASLATPATTGFAPLLRGVSAVADLAVMISSIYSVIDNLARLDEALAEALVDPDAFALEHVARLGELAQMRREAREAVDTIPAQAVVELALMAAGARWAPLKKLVLARGYYSDLETLLDNGE